MTMNIGPDRMESCELRAGVRDIISRIQDAQNEAYRFLNRSREALDAFSSGKGDEYYSVEYAALKRSSLDLTRALSKMRNGGE